AAGPAEAAVGRGDTGGRGGEVGGAAGGHRHLCAGRVAVLVGAEEDERPTGFAEAGDAGVDALRVPVAAGVLEAVGEDPHELISRVATMARQPVLGAVEQL